MLTKRIIPCLDIDRGRVVKGVSFVDIRDAGDPAELAAFYDREGADELVFLDITASSDSRDIIMDVVKQVSEQLFIPLTVGGGVRSVEDVRGLLEAGADKVSLNTAAVQNPDLVAETSDHFGCQCIVVAMDVKRVDSDGDHEREWVAGPCRFQPCSGRGLGVGGLHPRRQAADRRRRVAVGRARCRARRGRAAGHQHGHGRAADWI